MENTERKNEIVLRLKQQNKIYYEEYADFSSSHFSTAYKKAASMVKEILSENEDFHNGSKSGNESRNQEQIYNILSFVGKRGSGKTSSMFSFAEFLRDYGKIASDKLDIDFRLSESNKLFTVLDSIEASILADTEDIFEIILARMLAKFQKLDKGELLQEGDYEFRRRRLYDQFGKLYKRTNFLKSKEHYMNIDNDMPIERLEELSATYNVKKEFSKLVMDYIKLVQYKDFSGRGFLDKDCYIVIVIDDIDMNIKHCYEMLEQIHKYLLIPNVIILLSYEPEFIEQVCEMHYLSEFKDLEKSLQYKESLNIVTGPLIKDYLEKMLDHDKRIHMPYLPDTIGMLKIEDDHKKTDFKKALFLKFYNQLNTIFYYDLQKNHILEPLTLRDLSNFYNALKSRSTINFSLLYETDENKINGIKIEEIESEIKNYEENYRWFMSELINRFLAGEKREQRRFQRVIESPYEDKISTISLSLSPENRYNRHPVITDYYGLLFEMISILRSPIHAASEKKYVELLTVYFTALFAYIDVQIKYAHICYKLTKDETYSNKKIKWENKDAILKKSGSHIEKSFDQSISSLILGNIYDHKNPMADLNIGYMEMPKINLSLTYDTPYPEIKDLDENEKFVKSIFQLSKYLLFTNYYDQYKKNGKALDIKINPNNKIMITTNNISFDVTIFIWNLNQKDKIIECLSSEISHVLYTFYPNTEESLIKIKLVDLIQDSFHATAFQKSIADIEILSMPDLIMNMWKNTEKLDIELDEAKNHLEKTFKQWDNEIYTSLKYITDEDGPTTDFEFIGFSAYLNEIFDLIEQQYGSKNTNNENMSNPSD